MFQSLRGSVVLLSSLFLLGACGASEEEEKTVPENQEQEEPGETPGPATCDVSSSEPIVDPDAAVIMGIGVMECSKTTQFSFEVCLQWQEDNGDWTDVICQTETETAGTSTIKSESACTPAPHVYRVASRAAVGTDAPGEWVYSDGVTPNCP